MLSGIIASRGVAFGKALVVEEDSIVFDTNKISDTEKEINDFLQARTVSIEQLTKIKAQAAKTLGPDKEAIFEGHIMLLEDEELEAEVCELIRSNQSNAALAVHEVIEGFANMMQELDDPYLKERASDFRDVGNRLIRNILHLPIVSLSTIDEEVILVAKDLTPSQTVQVNLDYVKGFITEIGGSTSHSAIMARSLELPALVGVNDLLEKTKNGDFLLLNAIENEIIINPTTEQKAHFEKIDADLKQEALELEAIKDLPATTLDGKTIELVANIGSTKDSVGAVKYSAEGVGLYRTEFLFMDVDELPDEEIQFQSYKDVLDVMGGELPLIIRTMDIGGDKNLPYLDQPEELNPFLGWRAIRIFFDRKDIMRTQIRALLRASAFGNIKIMFPMVSSVEEFRMLKSFIEGYKKELKQEKIAFNEDISVGIMVETPAAAFLADKFAEEVDFFSIGTNDLTQYTLAVDRGNQAISNLYNPISPAVVRAIKMVIDASHSVNKWTGMCGELASDERAAALLLGLGLDEFSMSSPSIPRIKRIIRKINYSDAKLLADHVLTLATVREVEAALEEFSRQYL